jgi:hypothetical protein
MKTISVERLRDELEEGIRGRRCVQMWLGYGEVLFLGFGDEVIPEPPRGQRHEQPPYQLQTEFADWRVEEGGALRGTDEDDREHAVAAANLLLGRHATDWHLDERTFSLTIHFEGNLTLTVVPVTDEYVEPDDPDDPDDWEAWAFVNCAAEYLHVLRGGGLYLVPTGEFEKAPRDVSRLDQRHGGYP